MANQLNSDQPDDNLNVPFLLYGTAWKEGDTAKLTQEAFEHGFTGVDTANYPTAYEEPLTGDGLATIIQAGVHRSDLFVCVY